MVNNLKGAIYLHVTLSETLSCWIDSWHCFTSYVSYYPQTPTAPHPVQACSVTMRQAIYLHIALSYAILCWIDSLCCFTFVRLPQHYGRYRLAPLQGIWQLVSGQQYITSNTMGTSKECLSQQRGTSGLNTLCGRTGVSQLYVNTNFTFLLIYNFCL